MDNNPQSASGNGEENVGISDDLRCKGSDGKQWRCTAMSMPDKTVCEKHYIQAKRRAANSSLRASLKKAKRKSLGETDIYLESKIDDFDTPFTTVKIEDYSPPTKKYKENNLAQYSPETPVRSSSMRNSLRSNDDDLQRDVEFEETWKSYKTPPLSAIDSSRSRSQRSFDASAMMEHSDGSTYSIEDAVDEICHQCRRIDRSRVIRIRKCDRRGFCDHCISTWYSDISLEEIEKVCPACHGICNCKVCLRGDNMVKVRIREIPVLDKLQYLYCLLSSVLPVVKQIHQEQCFEVELEKKFHGTDIDLVRAKLNADEQINICRIPIIDYHRHCGNCLYDLCLHCCQDLREALLHDAVEDQMAGGSQDKEAVSKQVKDSRARLCISDKYPGWKANPDGSIPCPPKEYGGCNHSSLKLSRIFKMNWIAKLVKNVEEMVTGCKVSNASTLSTSGFNDSTQCAYREYSDDNILYCPSSEDLKAEGINKFRKHWVKGEPVIVKKLFDSLSSSSWNPMVIWKGIQETSDEKMKDGNRIVKAIDFLSLSEVDIELGQFIKGYSEGRRGEDGSLQMLKLKDWPPPGASEEFLLYQRPDFISKLPLLEYIHSRLGLLNVAAKLLHYSLQNDAGPKIYISYGTNEELGRGDSVTNLHNKMRDMVYLLAHMHEVKPKGFEGNESLNQDTISGEEMLPDLLPSGHGMQNKTKIPADKVEIMEEDQGVGIPTQVGEIKRIDDQEVEANNENDDIERIKDKKLMEETRPGVHWDIFRRQDVPELVKYLQKHPMDFGKPDNVTHSLYDGTSFLNGHHISKLREEFGVEPWSFEQKLGEAVFVPAGCPFQMRNLKSTVLLALDFLSPESVGEAARMAEEIRCLPNDHETKIQVLETECRDRI